MKRKIIGPVVVFVLVWLNAFAISNLPLPAEIFEVNGKEAFLMKPEKPAKGDPWVWYAPTLSNYPHRSQQFYFEQLLKRGIAVAGYNLGEVRGAPKSSQEFSGFYNSMVEKGYSEKPILMGQSRGGLMMLCWAFRNPDKVKAFVGIYPVCNLTSWPMVRSKYAVEKDYGMPENDILKKLDEFNPPQNVDGLADNGVPIFILHGDADDKVPYCDNSELVKEAYEKADGEITVKIIEGKGHAELPEFFQDTDLVDFIIRQAKKK